MVEGESERMTGYGTAADYRNAFVWSELPKDVQHKVLSHLGIQDLCQVRCVCKEWRDVIHRRDFRSMYDMVNSSQEPSPVMCYVESSYPVRLECTAYDYEGRMWKKKMSSFPSLPQSSLKALNVRVHQYWPLNASLYSVGGLLCLHRWNFTRGNEPDLYSPPSGVSSWTVWNPSRNRWKKLPPCKYKVGGIAPFFVHAFVSDEGTKAYKILMASDPNSHPNHFNHDEGAVERKLVTEIYDSATGMWADGAEHTLRVYPVYRSYAHIGLNRRGVLCNGVIYFATGRNDSWLVGSGPDILLSYDIKKDEWRQEEIHNDCHPVLFEWDGRLMALKVQTVNRDIGPRFIEWDPVRRMWKDTDMEMPWKILEKFQYYSEGFSIVASGNHLAVTGCTDDDGFRIAVYKRAENYWRMPPSGTFSDKLKPARVEGLVLHTPSLDWRP